MIAIDNNGTIEILKEIPKSWGKTIGYNYSDKATIYADGFRELVIPTFDPITQRMTQKLIFDAVNDVFTYEVVDFTLVEIDTNLLTKEDNEDRTELSILTSKGVRLYEKTKNRLIRRNKKGLITKLRAKKVREILHPAFRLLLTGDLDLANDLAVLIPTNSNADIEAELVNFKTNLAEIQ